MRKIPAHVVWPGFVIGLLGMSATLITITVIAAVSDPSFAVEANYHEKALRWDEHVEQQRTNAELGWQVDVELGAIPESEEPAMIVRLTDGSGEPLVGATIEATYFHYAAAKNVQALGFHETKEPGVYAAPALLNRSGLWQFQMSVASAGRAFTYEQTLETGRVGG